MTVQEFQKQLEDTENMAFSAIPKMPSRSKYRPWISEMIGGSLPAYKYTLLRSYLIRLHGQS